MKISKEQKKQVRRLLFKVEPESKSELLFDELEEELKDLRKDLLEAQTREQVGELMERLDELDLNLETLSTITSEEKGYIETRLDDLRADILSKIHPGGNANRQIRVEGSVMSQKYTDINFTGASASILSVNDDTNKRVNIIFPSTAGASGYTVTSMSGTYTALQTSGDNIFLVDASGGNATVNLPTAIGNTAKFSIKKIDSTGNTVTTNPTGGQTIDGDTDKVILFPNTTFAIISDNINWWRIN